MLDTRRLRGLESLSPSNVGGQGPYGRNFPQSLTKCALAVILAAKKTDLMCPRRIIPVRPYWIRGKPEKGAAERRYH